jgi:tetratricopeptide (TPR) repeat protein
MLASAAAMALLAAPALPGDADVADALAASALILQAQGRAEKAKALCYKALAQDEHCAEALFVMGCICEQETFVEAALVFYGEALLEYAGPKMRRASAAERAEEVRQRIQRLDPSVARLKTAMQEYADELGTLLKKNTDGPTQEEAGRRLRDLELTRYVDRDKLPRPAPPEPAPKVAAEPGPGPKVAAPPAAPPRPSPTSGGGGEAEQALRAAGWATIKGSWRLLGRGLYEVTDGRLEAPALLGTATVSVLGGGAATVALFARYKGGQVSKDLNWPQNDRRYAPGYGMTLAGTSLNLYNPTGCYITGGLVAHYDQTLKLPEAPKHDLCIQLTQAKSVQHCEMFANGSRVKMWNYQLPQQGPFVIMVRGTARIELPQVIGQ